ncbi:MAG TPA: FkbM family methyltransferase [Stellaceae bacterium]|nr:FkbM family methyltransferase [Stellaceae bacterium]
MSASVAAFRLQDLSARQGLTYAAHLFKAVSRQHHRELLPILRPLIPADAIVLDIGGHAGQFAKLFAGLAPRGRVYSFEPGGYARSILSTVIRFSRLGNVTVVPTGLGDRAGEAVLSVPIKRSGSLGFGLSHLGGGETGRALRTETVAIDTVDAFINRAGIRRVDFIKADIEGWELRMLTGAAATLARFKPPLLLELTDAHLARAGDSLAATWSFLTGLGYRPHGAAADLGTLRALDQPVEGDIFWLAG